MSDYSQALELQLELLRWLDDPRKGERMLRMGVGMSYEEAPEDKRPDVEGLITDIKRDLAASTPFYWAPDICDLIEQTAPAIPDWTFSREDLPVDVAFHWFARPLSLPPDPSYETEDDEEPDVRAKREEEGRASLNMGRGLAALTLGATNEALVAVFYMSGGGSHVRGQYLPHAVLTIPLGVPLDEGKTRVTALSILHDHFDRELHYVAGMLAFLKQSILVAARSAVDRATRRRNSVALEALHRDPYVRVVELRRRSHEAGETPSVTSDVEWTCQWVVRGHWRQQWHPSLARHLPKWITPYVKGPEDKPLKPPRATVFAVIR